MGTPAQFDVERMSQRIQTARAALLRIAGVLVGLLQILLGGLLTVFALPAVLQYAALTPLLGATVLFWIIAGPITLICGVISLVGLGRYRLPQWIGGAAAFLSGIVMIVGVLAHVIPCAGPT